MECRRSFLKKDLNDEINAVRAPKRINWPVVLTREETSQILAFMDGVPQLIARLLYGSGLRISEAIRCGSKTSITNSRPSPCAKEKAPKTV